MKQRILLFGFIALLILSTGISLLSPRMAHAVPDNNDPDLDKKRGILVAARSCMVNTDPPGYIIRNNNKIDGDTDIDKMYADFIGNSEENVVVGFAIDSKNGVVTCNTLIARALIEIDHKEFGITADNMQNAEKILMGHFLYAGSGNKCPDDNANRLGANIDHVVVKVKYEIVNDGNCNSSDYFDLFTKEINKIGLPDKPLQVTRVAPLVGDCFTMQPPGTPGLDPGRGDFSVPGLGEFFIRRNMNPDNFDWMNSNNGFSFNNNHATMGDIPLDWGGNGFTDFKQDDTDSSSDFYPIGQGIQNVDGDYSYNGYGGPNTAIVDCHYVKKNASWIFKDHSLWGADAGGNITYKGEDAATGGKVSGGVNVAPKLTCNVQFTNPLTWLVCPLISLANAAVDEFDNFINQELTIDTNKLLDQDTDPGQGYFRAWSAMRYIAMSLLVIVALVMVISQALSIELFDAYTIRKVVPRMLIAIIFTAVSWELLKFAIEFSNALGLGVRSIIYQPFSGAGVIDGKIKTTKDALLSVNIVGGIAIATLGLFGLFSFIMVALMAVLTAAVILIFRKILVLMLLILSPLAIVCFILPGTQRAWRLWYDNFIKLLLMFVIISAFIASGRVFAALAKQGQTGDSGFAAGLVVFVAYYGPYFALPATLRLAGGAMSAIGNVGTQAFRRGMPTVGLGNYRAGRRKMKSDNRAARKQVRQRNRRGGNALANANEPEGGNLRTKLNAGIQKASLLGGVASGPGGWQFWKWNAAVGSAKDLEEAHEVKDALENDDIARETSTWDDVARAAHDSNTHQEFLDNSEPLFRKQNGWVQEETGEYEKNEDGSDKLDADGKKIPIMRDVLDADGDRTPIWDIDHVEQNKFAARYDYLRRRLSKGAFKKLMAQAARQGQTSYDTVGDNQRAAQALEDAAGQSRHDKDGNLLDMLNNPIAATKEQIAVVKEAREANDGAGRRDEEGHLLDEAGNRLEGDHVGIVDEALGAGRRNNAGELIGKSTRGKNGELIPGKVLKRHDNMDMFRDIVNDSEGSVDALNRQIMHVKTLTARPEVSGIPFGTMQRILRSVMVGHDDDGKLYSWEQASDELNQAMMQATSGGQALRPDVKIHGLAVQIPTMRRNIRKAYNSKGTPDEIQAAIDKEMTTVMSWLDSAGYSKAEQQRIFGDFIMDWNIEDGNVDLTADELKWMSNVDHEVAPKKRSAGTRDGNTVQHHVEQARTSEVSAQRRRNYEYLRSKGIAIPPGASEEEIEELTRQHQREQMEQMNRLTGQGQGQA